MDLARAVLAHAIDDLGRSIDTVKHQAKTVTVGTSRDDADVYDNDVVAAMQDAGVDIHRLTLPVLRVVRAQARVISRVTGVTCYRVDGAGDGIEEAATIRDDPQTGSAAGLASRADHGSPLMGSKRRVAELARPGCCGAVPTGGRAGGAERLDRLQPPLRRARRAA